MIKTRPQGLTAGQEKFAQLVAQNTGLSLQTVRTWVLAESGGRTDRDGNPLSILTYSGKLRNYGTPEAAAAATVALLRGGNKSYSHILDVARQPNATTRDELQAIIDSDWEGKGYAGTSGKRGTLLWGAFARLTGQTAPSSSTTTGSATPAGWIPPTVPGLPIPIPGGGILPLPWDLPGADTVTKTIGVAADWIGREVGKAFLYLALTVGAFALIGMGGARMLGIGVGDVARTATGARRPRSVAAGGSGELPPDF